jgi:serine protease inhibitor ecotin
MTQALYAHMNNKRKKKEVKVFLRDADTIRYSSNFPTIYYISQTLMQTSFNMYLL